MNSPLFSVIVPTFNRGRFVSEAIASVLTQTVTDLECVVVDDASPDPTRLPDALDPRVRLVRREVNGGPAAARNTGLAEARGRYVAFLDDDDLFTPDRLELALEGLQRAPVATCWTAFAGRAGHRTSGRRLEGNVADVILDEDVPHLGAVAVAREAALGFDESLDNLEDVDWWLRTVRLDPVTTVARVGHLFRLHDTPRHRTGTRDRIRCNLEFQARQADYFATHRRAAAFRWKRVGLLANSVGDKRLARTAFLKSFRQRPAPSTAWHLARSTVGHRRGAAR
jgi:glycosyltransferase involved in cell wall biosynthesis